MAKTCLFCSGGGPFSNEHLIAEWIAAYLGLTQVSVTMTKLGEIKPPWTSFRSFGTTVNDVCARCNNGWMSQLEADAKRPLSKLIRPSQPVTLTPDEQVIISAWIWKLGIVHEKPSGVTYFNDAERTCLMNGDAPPTNGVRIWLGAHDGSLDGNLRGGPADFGTPQGDTIAGYVMTVTIRRFAAQLLCVRGLPGVSLSARAKYNLTAAEVLIWPENDGNVSWPPALILDDDLLDKWHLRFNP